MIQPRHRRTGSHRFTRAIRAIVAGASAGLLLTLAACGGSAGGGPAGQKPDTLFIGTVNPIVSWNPINQSDQGGIWSLSFALDTLLAQTEPLKFVPKLAQEISTSDNQTYTVKLQPDAEWTDGEPITADDVVFTFNLIAHPDSATVEGSNMTMFAGTDSFTGKLPEGKDSIPGLKAIDEHTVEFRMKNPIDPNWVKEMIGTGLMILPEHKLADIAPGDFDDSKYATMPDVFSGPYKITKYTGNVSVEFAANDNYYLGAPKIKKVIHKIMPAANLAGELQSGAIQMNSGGFIGNLPITDLPTVQGMQNIRTSVNPQLNYQTMQFNTKTLQQTKLRLGIAHAINRPQMVEQLLKGHGEYFDGPYASEHPYHAEEIKPIAYDPELAKKLIAESGWDTSKKIRFLVPTGNATREQAADIIEANLKAVGLNVTAERFDVPTVLSMLDEGEFDLCLMGYGSSVDPDVSSFRLSGSPSNNSGYDNPKNDQLLMAGKSEPDPQKRQQIYTELQRLWQQDMPVLTTYAEQWVGATSKQLAVGGPTPFWEGTTANLQDWEFAEPGN